MDKLQARVGEALERGAISFSTLQSVAGQAMSMAVAIRAASLYTQAMFAEISALEKSGLSMVDLSLDSSADLRGEMQHWLRITSTTHEGPWQKAPHSNARLTSGASNASSPAWRGVVYATDPPSWQARCSRESG